jgi:hypothetical protein
MGRAVATAAGAFMLAACSSMSSLDIVGSTPPVTTVQLESEPPGADAKTSLGPGCKTPCSVDLPAGDFSVTFALAGYQPQTVPVRVQPPVDRVDDEVGAVQIPILDPNPVYAELQRTGPATKTKRAARKQQAAPSTDPPPGPAAGPSPWPQIR